MKRTHSESDMLEPVEKDEPDSELARAFRKVKKSASVDSGNHFCNFVWIFIVISLFEISYDK